jgi:hypothetical protein
VIQDQTPIGAANKPLADYLRNDGDLATIRFLRRAVIREGIALDGNRHTAP